MEKFIPCLAVMSAFFCFWIIAYPNALWETLCFKDFKTTAGRAVTIGVYLYMFAPIALLMICLG